MKRIERIQKLMTNVFFREGRNSMGRVKIANVENNTLIITQKDFDFIYDYLRKHEDKFKGDCNFLEINWIK